MNDYACTCGHSTRRHPALGPPLCNMCGEEMALARGWQSDRDRIDRIDTQIDMLANVVSKLKADPVAALAHRIAAIETTAELHELAQKIENLGTLLVTQAGKLLGETRAK